ncbi:MAG: isocitrate dehydrogenase kinase/phosphatase AceK regulatory subunit [Pseudomonadota bacterium]
MTAVAKHDFGTLRTEDIAYAGLTELDSLVGEAERAEALAGLILDIFTDYYTRSRRIPWLAKQAFERCDWRGAIDLSHERIAIFSVSIQKAVPILKLSIRAEARIGGFWNTVEERFRRLVADRYEADLAMAYLNSIRRWVYKDTWLPASYGAGEQRTDADFSGFVQRHACDGPPDAATIACVVEGIGLEATFTDLPGDAARAADRIARETAGTPVTGIEAITAGFFRNRGAYVIGRLLTTDGHVPLALALLHGAEGVTIDAVILRETTLRHIFSSTLANFHVTVTAYHELVSYLHLLMPRRPRGMHYSTVGYNHVGKLAVMDQISAGLAERGQRLDHAPGPRGSVAMGFTGEGSDYVLKVIRDTPTENYKWESFDGIEAVLGKYRQVHELNRSGSMLDNILYTGVTLPAEMFATDFLDELLDQASETVTRYRDEVLFNHLIVQRKMIPVPLFLANCTREEAEIVTIRLGQCIRNNAATGVFNRDLDGRNYGVSSLRFVYLFDYDAVVDLAEVKVRTNADRFDGEEDIPDWFFEEGVIFLPEELEAHLRLPDRDLRRLFREAHGELLTLDYWTRMQRLLAEGRVAKVRTYPRAMQLDPGEARDDLSLTRL